MTVSVGTKVRDRYWNWKGGTVVQVFGDDDDGLSEYVLVGVWRKDRSTQKMGARYMFVLTDNVVEVEARKASVRFTKTEARALYNKADAAGRAAAEAMVPAAMVVGTPKDLMGSLTGGDDGGFDETKPVYYVSEGVCGFAWVTVRPGNSSFARWLEANTRASRGYYGGMQLWVSGYGQSMQRKEAYARAFADVLREAGVDAFSESRMD